MEAPILSPSAKNIVWTSFNRALAADPFEQGAMFGIVFGAALDEAPATVRAEFDGLAIEGEWAINAGRSEVRFLAADGALVQTIRGPLVV